MKKILVQITGDDEKVVAQKMLNVEDMEELEKGVAAFLDSLPEDKAPKYLGQIICWVLMRGEYKRIEAVESELAQEGFFDCDCERQMFVI